MGKGLIALAIPIFIITLLTERWALKKKHQKYNGKDALTSIAMGTGNYLISLLLAGLIASLYSYFYQFRLMDIPKTALNFGIFILLEDYCYYWFHRISHVSRLWWCAHETHHSSNAYNLTTALRQTWTGAPIGWIFWAPLLFLGIPPEWVVLQQAISLLYQYFLHTELIKSLGPLEWILNTPSHHRVHHGTNLLYLDRNYAGIFIIWDRLHGTFQREEEKPTYGTLSPVNSYNPFVVGFHMWVSLFRDVWNTAPFIHKLGLVFKPPGWKPDGKGLTTKQLQQSLA